MKKQLHPDYNKTTITCACGNVMETRSTGAETLKVDLCSACHPFFTGKQKFVDTAGRVDKFRARMEAAAKKAEKPKEEKPAEKVEKDNKETLKEIKEQITAPIAVTQESTSDVESAAAEELEISKEEELDSSEVENKTENQ